LSALIPIRRRLPRTRRNEGASALGKVDFDGSGGRQSVQHGGRPAVGRAAAWAD